MNPVNLIRQWTGGPERPRRLSASSLKDHTALSVASSLDALLQPLQAYGRDRNLAIQCIIILRGCGRHGSTLAQEYCLTTQAKLDLNANAERDSTAGPYPDAAAEYCEHSTSYLDKPSCGLRLQHEPS